MNYYKNIVSQILKMTSDGCKCEEYKAEHQ